MSDLRDLDLDLGSNHVTAYMVYHSTHRPLLQYQISLKSENLRVRSTDGRADGRSLPTFGRTYIETGFRWTRSSGPKSEAFALVKCIPRWDDICKMGHVSWVLV